MASKLLYFKEENPMNKLNVAKLLKDTRAAMSKYSPEILTGIGIAGMITTTILAVKATPKALKCIDAKREELELRPDENLTAGETVQAAWKCYIPATVCGVTSVACLIGASYANNRSKAALAAAYNLSAATLTEYRDKVTEYIGEKEERKVRDEIAKDRLHRDPINQSAIIVNGNGNTRFLDSISKRRFACDIDKIKRAQNDLNARMLEGEDYVSLNDFYYEIGLDGVEFGDDLGWNIYNGRKGMIKVNFHPQLDTDEVPCIVLDYDVMPVRGYTG